jgi:hypothetical protein
VYLGELAFFGITEGIVFAALPILEQQLERTNRQRSGSINEQVGQAVAKAVEWPSSRLRTNGLAPPTIIAVERMSSPPMRANSQTPAKAKGSRSLRLKRYVCFPSSPFCHS